MVYVLHLGKSQDDILHLLKYIICNVYKIDIKMAGSSKRKRETMHNAEKNIPLPQTATPSECNHSVTLFLQYKSELILNGTLQWRVHSDNKDCAVMNDINPATGSFKVFTSITNRV